MNIVCSKQDLQKGLSIAMKAVGSKSIKTILECIHIKAQDNTITLDSFDTVTAIKTTIYADVAEPGEAAVPAKILADMIAKLPDGEVSIQREDGLLIKAGRSSMRINEMDADQFPDFPEIEGNKYTVKQGILRDMIDGTAFSAAVTDTNPILKGILFEAEGGILSLVAIDGYRMGKKTAVIESDAEAKCVIPAKTLKDAARLFNDDEEDVDLYFGEGSCFIQLADTLIYTRLLDGRFVNYKSLIEQDYKTRIRVMTRQLEKGFEMVSVMSRDDSSNLVIMEITPDSAELTSNSDYGTACDSVPLSLEGDVMTVAFNAKYMLDALKAIDDEYLFIELTSPVKAAKLKPLEGEDFFYLVTPVKYTPSQQ